MDKYKVKEQVMCRVETRANNTKAIFSRYLTADENPKLEDRQFEVIAVKKFCPGSEYHMYTIVIDDDMVGWEIGEFHIQYQKINSKFKGRKFWDLTEEFMKPAPKDSK